MTLYLFKFNNYYNRIVKRYGTIDEYGEPLEVFENINFNPNDGIHTEQILNYQGTSPDYVICTKSNRFGTREVIDSRWYIINSTRTRAGQYSIELYRDVVADWWDDIINAPMFIEKAMLDTGNDLIFNSENMTYNQIKTEEILLRDRSGTPWYAAYISSDVGAIELTIPTDEITPDIEVSDLDQYDYNSYVEEDYYGDYTGPVLYGIQVKENNTNNVFRLTTDARNNSKTTSLSGETTWNTSIDHQVDLPTGIVRMTTQLNNYYNLVSPGDSLGELYGFNNYWNKALSKLNPYGELLFDSYLYTGASEGTPILQEDGKIIYAKGAGKYYKVIVRKTGTRRYEATVPRTSALGLKLSAAATADGDITSPPTGQPFTIDSTMGIYRITYQELAVAQQTLTIPATRKHCQDAPYDILMFPYKNEDIYKTLVGTTTTNSTTTSKAINQLMLKLAKSGAEGASEIYDVQIVPYCPIPQDRLSLYVEWADRGGSINIDKYEENKDYVLNDNLFVFFPTSSSFSKIIEAESEDTPADKNYTITVPDDPIEFKIANECDKYRLCSPNYNGQFEFSATKNRGVKGWNITCSYKPYSPYIKVSPIFEGLYGDDFGDARGLICGGDFSISQISDAFTNYELNNKNYQIIFDRQIQNMEINNAVQRERELFQSISGSLTGGVGLGMAGNMINPVVGGAGALAGTGISLAAGLRDIELNDRLRTEALDYTKDQFGYQLGNIKALPYNLTKVSAMNADNKLFPFIEKYTCTEREKEALRSKIQYNGMTVGVIDQIVNYIKEEQTYIKCQLIRLNIGESFNITNAIANELNKGVFI